MSTLSFFFKLQYCLKFIYVGSYWSVLIKIDIAEQIAFVQLRQGHFKSILDTKVVLHYLASQHDTRDYIYLTKSGPF